MTTGHPPGGIIAGAVEVKCCHEVVGGVITRPFTASAVARCEELRARYVSPSDPTGEAFVRDEAWRAIAADPASYQARVDASDLEGTIMPFACRSCGSRFIFLGGAIVKVPKDAA